MGIEADQIEYSWQHGYRMGFYRGGPVLMSALSAINIALWDLKARKLHVPIYELLGGKTRSKLRVYACVGGDRPCVWALVHRRAPQLQPRFTQPP
ncbi:hypothetical protein BDV12DRAFT_180194 [Aspergillus spectabilis]